MFIDYVELRNNKLPNDVIESLRKYLTKNLNKFYCFNELDCFEGSDCFADKAVLEAYQNRKVKLISKFNKGLELDYLNGILIDSIYDEKEVNYYIFCKLLDVIDLEDLVRIEEGLKAQLALQKACEIFCNSKMDLGEQFNTYVKIKNTLKDLFIRFKEI